MSIVRLHDCPLDPEDVALALRAIANGLRGCPGVLRAILFGSAARGAMTAASDLDVFVIVSHGIRSRDVRQYLPRPIAPIPVDLIVVEQEEFEKRRLIGGVCMEADRDGTEIYPIFVFPKKAQI